MSITPDPLPDLLPSISTNFPHPPPPSPPKCSSPPLADTVVRPFTSQGSTSRTPLQLLTYAYTQQHPDDRPASAGGLPMDSHSAKFGPYMSASARTSYTRVDVDSLPPPIYPPLPPLPTAFAPQDVAVFAIPMDAPTTPPDATATPTAATTSPTPDISTNTAQPPITEPIIPQTPLVSLTFLLVSGLRKTQTFEPETTIGRVKELVWNAWPARDAEWQDERPPAPSYLRILYLGKILQDDDTLLDIGFPTSLPSPSASASQVTPTIVHLSVRPYGIPSDDPSLNKKKRLSVAFGRRLSTVAVGVGVGVNNGREDQEDQEEARRTGCCTGCIIC